MLKNGVFVLSIIKTKRRMYRLVSTMSSSDYIFTSLVITDTAN